MASKSRLQVVPAPDALPKPRDLKDSSVEALPAGKANGSSGSSSCLKLEAVAFEVRGLPQGQKAWIIQQNGNCHLVRETHGVESEWLGDYPSIDHALQALSEKIA
jgi:hypothetical protein